MSAFQGDTSQAVDDVADTATAAAKEGEYGPFLGSTSPCRLYDLEPGRVMVEWAGPKGEEPCTRLLAIFGPINAGPLAGGRTVGRPIL